MSGPSRGPASVSGRSSAVPDDGYLLLSDCIDQNRDQECRPANTASVQLVSADLMVDTIATEPSGRIVPTLQNIVGSANLGVELDLVHIAQTARNAEYRPRRFCAVVMRIRHPKTTALVFRTGKIVVSGAKCEKDAVKAARKFGKIIYKLGYEEARFTGFAIHNVVASVEVRFPIRLEKLALEHMLFSSYEPELFPALIYRMKEPKVTLLVFFNGKVVLTGAKSRKQIDDAFEKIYPVLQLFRKPVPLTIV